MFWGEASYLKRQFHEVHKPNHLSDVPENLCAMEFSSRTSFNTMYHPNYQPKCGLILRVCVCVCVQLLGFDLLLLGGKVNLG